MSISSAFTLYFYPMPLMKVTTVSWILLGFYSRERKWFPESNGTNWITNHTVQQQILWDTFGALRFPKCGSSQPNRVQYSNLYNATTLILHAPFVPIRSRKLWTCCSTAKTNIVWDITRHIISAEIYHNNHVGSVQHYTLLIIWLSRICDIFCHIPFYLETFLFFYSPLDSTQYIDLGNFK